MSDDRHDKSVNVKRRDASINAVIIQIVDGKRYVSIECRDAEMLPRLNEEARRIFGLC